MIINILLIAFIYMSIGLVIHVKTEKALYRIPFHLYSRNNFMTLFLDVFLWLFFLIAMILVWVYRKITNY